MRGFAIWMHLNKHRTKAICSKILRAKPCPSWVTPWNQHEINRSTVLHNRSTALHQQKGRCSTLESDCHLSINVGLWNRRTWEDLCVISTCQAPGARRQTPGWPTRLVRCEKKSPVLLGISKLVKSCLLYLSTDYSMFFKLHPQSSCFLGISHFISDLSPNLEQILCAQVYVYQEYAYIIAYPYHMLYSCIRLSTLLHCLIYCIVLYYVILLHIIISNHIRSLACRTGK